MPKLILAALSMCVAASASAQCNIIDQDFDSFAAGTSMDSLPGWSDQAPGSSVFLGTNVDNQTTAIVFGTGTNVAKRRIDNIGLGQRFQISADIRVDHDGQFRLQCAPVNQGGNVLLNYRCIIAFAASSSTPVISYNYYGSSAFETLPLVLGAPARLVIDVDTQGNVATYYNGELLAVEPWATGGPFACPTPQNAAWLSNGPGAGPGMTVDNLCIGDAFATNYCTAAVNSTGVRATTSALGSPSIVANDMVLSTVDLPNFSFGYFLVSMGQGFVQNPAGSAGNLCLSGHIGRYARATSSGGNGNIVLALDLTAGIVQPNGSVAAVAADTWNFQLWHRDSMGGQPTTNFSDALTVTLTP